MTFPVEILAISDRAVAYVGRVVERAQPGDALPFITVHHLSLSGLDRIETFGVEARAAALATYERLLVNANACTRAATGSASCSRGATGTHSAHTSRRISTATTTGAGSRRSTPTR